MDQAIQTTLLIETFQKLPAAAQSRIASAMDNDAETRSSFVEELSLRGHRCESLVGLPTLKLAKMLAG